MYHFASIAFLLPGYSGVESEMWGWEGERVIKREGGQYSVGC